MLPALQAGIRQQQPLPNAPARPSLVDALHAGHARILRRGSGQARGADGALAPDAGVRACRPTASGLPTLASQLPGRRLSPPSQLPGRWLPFIDRPSSTQAWPHLLRRKVAAVLLLVPVQDAAHEGGDEGGAGVRARARLHKQGRGVMLWQWPRRPLHPADHRPSGRPASSCSRHGGSNDSSSAATVRRPAAHAGNGAHLGE